MVMVRPFVRNAIVAVALTGATLAINGGVYFGGPGERKLLLAFFGDDEAGLNQAIGVWWAFSALLITGLLVVQWWPTVALVLTGIGGAGHLLHPLLGPQILDLAVPVVLLLVTSEVRRRWMSALLLGVFAVGAYLIELRNASLPEGKLAPRPDAVSVLPVAGETVGVWFDAVTRSLPVLLVLSLAVAVGDGVRSRRRTVAMLRQRAEQLERDQHQRALVAAAEERARITREMHDVVAHGLSVIVAQAQGGAAALNRHPDRTADALQRVIETGRSSLAEMRRLLGVIGHADVAQPELGIGAVRELVDRVRAAGLPVRLHVEGQPAQMPPTVDQSAYRIIQEALTNTLKHAGPDATAVVSLRFAEDSLEVNVIDDGRGPSASPAGGHGLRGIGERVGLLGGDLAAGPANGGGFAVRARLPIGADT